MLSEHGFALIILVIGVLVLLPVIQGVYELVTSWRLYFLIGLVWAGYVFRLTKHLGAFLRH